MRRATPVREFAKSGVGIHSGMPCALRRRPAPWGTGLWFVGERGGVMASLNAARSLQGATGLAGEGFSVATVEHLLAALVASGVTDVVIEARGPEIPALDGSSQGWLDAVRERTFGPEISPLVVQEKVEFDGIYFSPSSERRVSVDVDFGVEFQGTASWNGSFESFEMDVAWARTFVPAAAVEGLRKAGRGKGATKENTVVLGVDTLRHPEEPIRHKLLDAIGDLGVLGRPLQGAMHVVRGTHARHLAALIALDRHAQQNGWAY